MSLMKTLLLAAAFSGALSERVLPDQAGRKHALSAHAGKKALVLISHAQDCPIAEKSVPEVRRLGRAYAKKGVVFLYVDASPLDTAEELRKHASDFGIELPILLDADQSLSRELGMTRTAEAVVVDPRTWKTLYQGAVDDRLTYGGARAAARNRYLAEALDEVLAGKPVRRPRSEVLGCLISYGR